MVKNNKDKNNSSNSLVFGQWLQTKIIRLVISLKRHMDDKTLNTVSSIIVQCLKPKAKQFLMDVLVILDNSDFALHNHS